MSDDTSVLDKLERGDVCLFDLSDDKRICTVSESCDLYFQVELTKEEMIALAAEILALANTMKD